MWLCSWIKAYYGKCNHYSEFKIYLKWFGSELTKICFFDSYQKWYSKKCLNDALCYNCNIFTCTWPISMILILLESYEADLSNSGYNIQFGEELTEIQTNLYSVCKHSDTFLAHCICTSCVKNLCCHSFLYSLHSY